VIHAAAMKQVQAAEYNPIECIRTRSEERLDYRRNRFVRTFLRESCDAMVPAGPFDRIFTG
jgi:hypothetical protein